MFLLPVCIGILVCALGPECSVLGTRNNVNANGAAAELEEYDRFLNEIYQYEKRLHKKEHLKQDETKVYITDLGEGGPPAGGRMTPGGESQCQLKAIRPKTIFSTRTTTTIGT
ncbi:hypothetical protein DPMN_179532 [Dreissena polymorpha]|uniref:Uncharacterized protein n=1 Tax=Dreissena polymorpha TaxID=45954 RepID=A0A9D4EF98_DREPO|nr:hypothetical protein DPMN_179532 [Dreissena polymorpha]